MSFSSSGRQSPLRSCRSVLWGTIAAGALFLIYSAAQAPSPAVNEPHYLAKARHFWLPNWCADDFFLNSSNPHLGFYLSIGWVAAIASLPTAAIVGRIVALMMFAAGWQTLAARLHPRWWSGAVTAVPFLMLHTLGNWSGEWVVGGVEGKVFSYGLGLIAVVGAWDVRPVMTGIALGGAIALHPVVGGWFVIVIAGAMLWLHPPSRSVEDPLLEQGRNAPSWTSRRLLICLALAALLGSIGVVPALQTLGGGSAAEVALADRLQVGVRLPHHLDPLRFEFTDHRYFAMLLALWSVLQLARTRSVVLRYFDRVVIVSLIIAAVGLLVAWGPRPLQELPLSPLRVKLLKFYPFRLADVLVPMAIAWHLLEALPRYWRQLAMPGRGCVVAGFAAVLSLSLLIPGQDRYPSRMNLQQLSAWQDACRWIDANMPRDSLFYATDLQWAFKWYAQRSEYVSFKDCPQDTAGVLEWYRRRRRMAQWARESLLDGAISREETSALARQTGITHLISSRFGPFEESSIYDNGIFRVYAIGVDAAGAPSTPPTETARVAAQERLETLASRPVRE